MFNIILDDLPAQFGGSKVRTDFRQVLKYYRIVEDSRFSDSDKAGLIIRIFFEGMPTEEPEKTWDFIVNYVKGPETAKTAGPQKKTFDFNVDHGRVFAAFRQVYGIDLRTANLHWWEFLELFSSIPDNTVLMKVIEIRGKKIPKKGDREQIQKLRRIKAAYALEQPERVQKANDAALEKMMEM